MSSQVLDELGHGLLGHLRPEIAQRCGIELLGPVEVAR
jgi:hypothetical protein